SRIRGSYRQKMSQNQRTHHYFQHINSLAFKWFFVKLFPRTVSVLMSDIIKKSLPKILLGLIVLGGVIWWTQHKTEVVPEKPKSLPNQYFVRAIPDRKNDPQRSLDARDRFYEK